MFIIHACMNKISVKSVCIIINAYPFYPRNPRPDLFRYTIFYLSNYLNIFFFVILGALSG